MAAVRVGNLKAKQAAAFFHFSSSSLFSLFSSLLAGFSSFEFLYQFFSEIGASGVDVNVDIYLGCVMIGCLS